MTNAPERIKAWPWNGKTYAGQWHVDGQGRTTEYIRLDIHEAAVAAARAEGMRGAARLARSLADQSQAEVGSLLNSAGQRRGLILVRDAARTLESVILDAAEASK